MCLCGIINSKLCLTKLNVLTSEPLMMYDVEKSSTITADASSYGLG
jgi:hypothetical protein